MAVILSLPRLFDAVVARFAAEGIDVPQTFGWLAPAEQMRTATRITWTPGDAGGSVGTIGPAKYPGGNPRQLATLNELCTVEITAFDDTAPTNERAQYQVTRDLFDAWKRAVYLAARGTYQILSATWAGGDRARRMGSTIRVVFAVQAPITDRAVETTEAIPESAAIDVELADATENLTV